MDKKLEDLAKKFSLLYIGFDECPCHSYVDTLFDEVYTCNNAKEAISLFETVNADFIFIDIDSTNFDWTEVVAKFREKVYDLPIVIITDLHDKDTFIKAITLNTTQAIFKPIKKDNLNTVLRDIVYRLQDKLDAKELHYKKHEEERNGVALSSLISSLDVIQNPIIVVSNDKIIHVNKLIYKLFKEKQIKLSKEPTLEDLSSVIEEFTDDMNILNIPYGKSFDIRYYYKTASLKRVFIPTKSKIKLEGYEDSFVVVFTDIAQFLMQIKMMNYQNNKIDNYKNLVEKLLAKQVFKDNKKAIISKLDLDEIQYEIDSNFDPEDIQVLRRDSSYKVTAVDYVDGIDSAIYDEVVELSELEDEINILIDEFKIISKREVLHNLAKVLYSYGGVIVSLIDFIDLGNAVCSLSDFLERVDQEQIDKSYKEMGTMMENIVADLSQWRENIFETKIALDIHYLDSSLLSSILQFQIGVTTGENVDSGELELF